MLIRSISIRNFYSFESATINFTDYTGIVQILGKNKDSGGSNGSGKSVIFDAVSWGIYGKTIRKSTEESLVNSKVGRDCAVIVEIDLESGDKVLIERVKRPSSLNFIINGVTRNKENASETQLEIDRVLQSDYKSFIASTVFGQHSQVDFLSSSPDDKRNIIKNCFNLDNVFSKRDSVKALKSEYTVESKTLTTILDSLKAEQTKLQEKVPDKKYKYVELPPLNEILKHEKRASEIKTKIATLNAEITKSKGIVSKLSESISKGSYTEESDCPVCKAKYQKTQSEADLSDLEDKKFAESVLIGDKKILIDNLTGELNSIKDSLAYSSSEWAKYNEKNKLVQDAKNVLDRLEEVNASIAKHEEKIKELSLSLEVMKFWEKAFSEQGMIRYIIRNILEYFNLKSNEYLSILSNNQFKIVFSDDLSEVITNNSQEVKFISLSGGEKRKVNLAIMLALQDLQNKLSKVQCNLIFFDEVGENLDPISMQAIATLLHTLKNEYPNKLVFVITHNDYLKNAFSEYPHIDVVKHKGISKIDYGSN
jgi:DNA repair exonuclease SbcCD ATPase subunit